MTALEEKTMQKRLTPTKEECLQVGYYSERYFVEGYNANGDFCFFDKETGEEVATIAELCETKEIQP